MPAIISWPLVRLSSLPARKPNSTDIGTVMSTASRKPDAPEKTGLPVWCAQLVMRNMAICAAMAPTVMEKFRPMPAMTGMMSARTRKLFCARRSSTCSST